MNPENVIETIARLPRKLVTRSTHYECRRCGTTIGSPDADCPYCGDADVVRFDLD